MRAVSGSDDATTKVETPLLAGIKVEVRTGFDRSWAAGFVVEEATDGGYRVKRRSDGEVLPVAIPRADVRRERKNSMWWY